MLRTLHLRFLTLGLFALLLAIPASPAAACMTNPCQACWDNGCGCWNGHACWPCDGGIEMLIPSSPDTLVTFVAPDRVELTFNGYDTVGFHPETSSVVAFPPLDSVASVDSVVNYDSRTRQPFSEVDFLKSEDNLSGVAVANLAEQQSMASESGAWYAFQSHITGTVEDGVPNYFVVELTLAEGVGPLDFIEELKAAGVFLTSGSTEDGIPNHHPYFRQVAGGAILVDLPDELNKPIDLASDETNP